MTVSFESSVFAFQNDDCRFDGMFTECDRNEFDEDVRRITPGTESDSRSDSQSRKAGIGPLQASRTPSSMACRSQKARSPTG
jgi:hypothetical protein